MIQVIYFILRSDNKLYTIHNIGLLPTGDLKKKVLSATCVN